MKRKYTQGYRDEWEQDPLLKSWLCKSKIDTIFKTSTISEEVKKAEISIVAALVEHNIPFRVMDHVREVISRAFHDSEIAKRFSCRRTKSAAIAYNVLGNNFEEKMLAELRPRPENETERSPVFSLIIDESTDVSTTKVLAVAVKYYSEKLQSPQTKFLCMVDLKGDTAQDLFDSLTCALSEKNLIIANLIGFAADTTNSIDPSSRMHFLPIQNMYLGTNVAMTLESLKDDVRMRSKIEEFLNRSPYYTIDIVETQQLNDMHDSSQEVLGAKEDSVHQLQQVKGSKRRISPLLVSDITPKKKICLTETIKKNINSISDSIIKRKNQKQMNEDTITTKKLEILEVQLQNEHMKLEKNKILMDLDIELKRNLLENSKTDLELKKESFRKFKNGLRIKKEEF
ncbi:unnamed protein product [Parnassius apollo]|uniref:(apollo) hypothetical protein n=1 Tax=Parnassius apollo TaxID=110799 RepID=A0A8S3YGL8_PARAO|nr:unnamed protein product [Parnassius apollo]